jgi:hypothetical protein
MAASPTQLTIRSYQVGFGDCFLLSFQYAAASRHILVDFGTMALPPGRGDAGAYMLQIANQIKADCGGKLDAVIATHRHRDHISGFNRKAGKGSGDVIRSLQPDVVIQPWTEDPKAKTDATTPTEVQQNHHFRASLVSISAVAESIHAEAARFGVAGAQLAAIGMDNISNPDAIDNLATMASKANYYVYHGSASGLEKILPGVTISVLGPPTLKQTDSIRRQTDTNQDEFWMLRAAFWGRAARTAKAHSGTGEPRLRYRLAAAIPPSARWFRHQMLQDRSESLLSIVRSLDNQMNNTSVILLMEANGKLLLFPGDAQWENWQYALSDPGTVSRLKKVDVYKVGHHGSRNATPKTLWNGFTNATSTKGPKQLKTFLSTLPGVHGHEEAHTEVPRQTLLKELTAKSLLTDTESMATNALRDVSTISL